MPCLVDVTGREMRLSAGMTFQKIGMNLTILGSDAAKGLVFWTKRMDAVAQVSFPLVNFGHADVWAAIRFIVEPLGFSLRSFQSWTATLSLRMSGRHRPRIARLVAQPRERSLTATGGDGTIIRKSMDDGSRLGIASTTDEGCAEVGFYLAALAGLTSTQRDGDKFIFTP